MNIYGIPRMTSDIDLLLDFDPENIDRFNKTVSELDFSPVAPISLETLLDSETRKRMISEKNLIAYSYYSTRSNYMSLDVLIDSPISFNDLWESKEERVVDQETTVFIVSLEDLISLKKYANRNQDRQEILLSSGQRNRESRSKGYWPEQQLRCRTEEYAASKPG